MDLYRTVFQIEVLSRGPYDPNEDLEQINYDIVEGSCSGQVTKISSEAVTPEQMAELLTAQGSDPSFLLSTGD